MFTFNNNFQMNLHVGGHNLCTLEVTPHSIRETYGIFIAAMEKITKWENPEFALLFETNKGVTGIKIISDQPFVVIAKDGLSEFLPLNFQNYNLPQNADQEELLFLLAEEFANDINNNIELITAGIIHSDKNMREEYVLNKIMQMVDTLMEALNKARKSYNIPEFIKVRLMENDANA